METTIKGRSAKSIRRGWLWMISISALFGITWAAFGPMNIEGMEASLAARLTALVCVVGGNALVFEFGFRRRGSRLLGFIQVCTALGLFFAPLQWLLSHDRATLLWGVVGSLLSIPYLLLNQRMIALNRALRQEREGGERREPIDIDLIRIGKVPGHTVRVVWLIFFTIAALFRIFEVLANSNAMVQEMGLHRALPLTALELSLSLAFITCLGIFSYARRGIKLLLVCQALILARLLFAVSPLSDTYALLSWDALFHLLSVVTALPLFVYSWKLMQLNLAYKRGIAAIERRPLPGTDPIQKRWRLLFLVGLGVNAAFLAVSSGSAVLYWLEKGIFTPLIDALLFASILATWKGSLYLYGYRGQIRTLLWIAQLLTALFFIRLTLVWTPFLGDAEAPFAWKLSCTALLPIAGWTLATTARLIGLYGRSKRQAVQLEASLS